MEFIVWNAVFLGTGALTALCTVAAKRVEYILEEEEATAARKKLLWFTAGLTAAVLGWIVSLLCIFRHGRCSTMIFLVAQPLVNLVHAVQLLLKQHAHRWEGSRGLIAQSQLVKDVTALLCCLLNDLHLWIQSGVFLSFFDVVLFMHARKIFAKLVTRVGLYQNTCKLQQAAEQFFPQATPEEIKEYNDMCMICLDQMDTGRRTRCGHLFHLECLVGWLEAQAGAASTSCPKCRWPLGVSTL
eukprot:TRINITY_DN4592_c0_g1_i4.p1 TRINITY_DN4592_c0_g1~~TRINITY_DN4592_c0_g1_i4.p1  ORF type:complete len:242 (-),score=55.78 TRINITY_DN4592_c0_g1_i4:241-966(-)